MRKLKLIWDFKGPDGKKTAEHHLIHLKEYVERKDFDFIASGVEAVSENHHLAFVAVEEANMIEVRDDLRPHRGQLWTKTD
ncbi:hypothetical protein BST97_00205 [Nonlabens spongiae]|uniref:YCII-related domain-containing protein n=1 Tax=Nonlabens spongiae TaxID=331648 RepID=A0A1W6MG54_9FLAO|nr:hypothetical protein [Nonlabens spongiae]ARN76550.1 hypothetical protein BST97_00205 [Nonlabens spongiae]